MKQIIFFSFIFFFGFFTASAQNAQAPADAMTAKFKVYGNCGMCEKRIEKAAHIKGVYTADWDEETQILVVSFDSKKVKPSQIQKAVAAVGHDTDKFRADDKVYSKLHSCCQYERPAN